ncbi:hypothetical protein BO94DRAFT_624327 [Aspergillus sclerotioniger CBS 115572]|uniref:DUF4139 domain-containing protein n=1 Tax=Aspergillus sclerotioniger CBS 115572 TaxID=1450535 RepID=A0A317WPU0_9EURO|nr:hypothetical protein BO94DRAFT_624327 [Aspergillus sclerotioniger CBS 115572]PWY87127.1 hypothetical protein BO94DRAFT_624327 [Aspergillus sclerotioniger CBS 115572]
MADISSTEIDLAELSTTAVTFHPSRATITREIPVAVQPGPNKITIHGLDRAVDIDSIRIVGSGPATVTDIQTEFVKRRDPLFSDSEDSSSDEDSSFSDEEDTVWTPDLESARANVASAEEEYLRAQCAQETAAAVIDFLDRQSTSFRVGWHGLNVGKLNGYLTICSTVRGEKAWEHAQAGIKMRKALEKKGMWVRKCERLEEKARKEKSRRLKEVSKERQRKVRERKELREKRERERAEKRRFWTRMVGQVVVHLDGQERVVSSRRGSMCEKPKIVDEEEEEKKGVVLRLTYVVPGLSWTPRYDLSINTPSSSAKLIYRAQFSNVSSETWRDAKVTLSTSQALFAGLGERIPSLQTWNLVVESTEKGKDQPSWDKILRSVPEEKALPSVKSNHQGLEQQPRPKPLFNQPLFQPEPVFGRPPTQCTQPSAFGQPTSSSLFGQAHNPSGQARGGIFGVSPQPSAPDSTGPPAVGASASPFARPVAGGLFGAPAQPPTLLASTGKLTPESGSESDDESVTVEELPVPSLEVQDSFKQDYGLTTTYELPGRRSLAPSSVPRRHVLAELDLDSVSLAYVIVPKHRAAAFLRAEIKNSSSVNILRGKVGMTIDGTFLGTTQVPSCSPNESFTLSLGVDPSIQVTYGKPIVKPVTGGFFNKETAAVFRRTCVVKNTRSNAVDVTVMDQVPVSEDERVGVQILEPKGLNVLGDEVTLPLEKEGKGTAKLGVNGEIKWVMKLEPGKEVRLVLEYEARVPVGSEVNVA